MTRTTSGRDRGSQAARLGLGAVVFAALSACGPAPLPSGINDPREKENRQNHALNLALDRGIVRPTADVYGEVVPTPIRDGIDRVASNIDLPQTVVNGVLQGNLKGAAQNTARFVVNTTVGILGLFDPATRIGLEGDPTDFGETLHVWGVEEGAYVELPLLGPKTERDLVGTIVDLALNPLRFVLKPAEANLATGIQVVSGLSKRNRYSDTIDSILYESADSYAQQRLLYLENRRYELGQTGGDSSAVDPYEDPYGQ